MNVPNIIIMYPTRERAMSLQKSVYSVWNPAVVSPPPTQQSTVVIVRRWHCHPTKKCHLVEWFRGEIGHQKALRHQLDI